MNGISEPKLQDSKFLICPQFVDFGSPQNGTEECNHIEILPPIPDESPDLLKALDYLESLQRVAGKKPKPRKRKKKQTTSKASRLNGFTAFKSFYSRDVYSVCQGVISSTLSKVWQTEKNQNVWDNYARHFRRYQRREHFCEWLVKATKSGNMCNLSNKSSTQEFSENQKKALYLDDINMTEPQQTFKTLESSLINKRGFMSSEDPKFNIEFTTDQSLSYNADFCDKEKLGEIEINFMLENLSASVCNDLSASHYSDLSTSSCESLSTTTCDNSLYYLAASGNNQQNTLPSEGSSELHSQISNISLESDFFLGKPIKYLSTENQACGSLEQRGAGAGLYPFSTSSTEENYFGYEFPIHSLPNFLVDI